MWKNIVEPDRPQMTIWRLRNAFSIAKAKMRPTLTALNTCIFPTAKSGWGNVS